MALGIEVGLGPCHIVLDGAPVLLPQKGGRLQFSALFYCCQTAGCIKMPLGMELGLSSGDFVLDGDPASPPLKRHSPQFLSNVRCGQTTRWMKTPLGTEVDLGPGHIVLDGVPALCERGTAAPIFSVRVSCGHGRPSQLLLSSCCTRHRKVSHYFTMGMTHQFSRFLSLVTLTFNLDIRTRHRQIAKNRTLLACGN